MSARSKIIATTLALTLFSNVVHALTAVRPIEGYKCMRVYIPEEKRFDPSPSAPVFEAPTETSRRIGFNGSGVIVKWPLNEANGFVEILWGQKGIKAWIQRDILRPWRTKWTPPGPASECVPSIMSDGGVGFGNALPH